MDKSTKQKTHKIKSAGKREIDLMSMAKAVWKKLWLVILIAAVAGGLTYAGTKMFIKPIYRSSFTAYVNNKKEVDMGSLSSSDITASKSLARSYAEIITSRNVLSASAKTLNLEISDKALKKMVSTTISNETEIISVNVDTTSPELSYRLASAVVFNSLKYMPTIVEGSSMKIIDAPYYPTGIYSPSYIKLTIVGALAGFLITALIICIRQLLNDKVQTESELSEHYTIPVVGVIPDMINESKNKEGYYYYRSPSDENNKDNASENEEKKQ